MFSVRAMRTKLQDVLHLKKTAMSKGKIIFDAYIFYLHFLVSYYQYFSLALDMRKHYL